MAANNFQACLAETLKWEGGWADHPKDPGGATMKGITLATFRRWRPNASKADLKNISQDMIEAIYKTDYWVTVGGDTLAKGVDLATFDYGVNSGPATARKKLLKVIGGSDVETVRKLCAARLTAYKSLKNWLTFGKGWTRRIAAIEAKATAWALVAQKTSSAASAALTTESVRAKGTATQQKASAAATSGSTVVGFSTTQPDQVAWWIVAAVIIGAIGLVGWLIWRAHVNSERAKAFEAEAWA